MADYCSAMRFSLCLFAVLLPAAALAQTPAAPAKSAKPQIPPIESLFSQLKAAQDEQQANAIAQRIVKQFQQSGSASVDLLMARANVALAAADTQTAKKLVDTVTDVAPNYAEGWRVRAGMLAAAGDDQGAMRALGKTVTINPRHFAAMLELAQMFEAYGNKKGALKLYRQVLSLNPQAQGAQFRVRALSRELEGQGI